MVARRSNGALPNLSTRNRRLPDQFASEDKVVNSTKTVLVTKKGWVFGSLNPVRKGKALALPSLPAGRNVGTF